jgi:hypothetical protein
MYELVMRESNEGKTEERPKTTSHSIANLVDDETSKNTVAKLVASGKVVNKTTIGKVKDLEIMEEHWEVKYANVRPCVPRRTLSRDECIVLELQFF